jgi:cyclopropane-fatty-acyl-phospholipid synthase
MSTREGLRDLPAPRGGPVGSIAQRVLLRGLEEVTDGAVVVTLPDGSSRRFGAADADEVQRLTIHRDAFWRRLALRGRVGFGEAYVAGDWTTGDLPGLLGLFARNIEIARERNPLKALLRANEYRPRVPLPRSKRRSERDIHYHYDLGNDLYELFLDPTMAYSCAVFEQPGQSLEDAQATKNRRIAERLAIGRDDHVLEIGCGWGGFAIQTARETGARVTGITISRAQFEEAERRVAAAGLSDRVEIVYRDYRDVTGSFSKIVSIEMLEAIGERQYGTYFETIDRLLAPAGAALVQTIAVPDERFELYKRTRDWIQVYVFPGGLLPSLGAMTAAMRRTSRLVPCHVEEIGPHYADTLRLWRQAFLARLDDVRELGYDDAFIRIWEYYLAFCEAGFRERIVRDIQVVLARPGGSLPASLSRPT